MKRSEIASSVCCAPDAHPLVSRGCERSRSDRSLHPAGQSRRGAGGRANNLRRRVRPVDICLAHATLTTHAGPVRGACPAASPPSPPAANSMPGRPSTATGSCTTTCCGLWRRSPISPARAGRCRVPAVFQPALALGMRGRQPSTPRSFGCCCAEGRRAPYGQTADTGALGVRGICHLVRRHRSVGRDNRSAPLAARRLPSHRRWPGPRSSTCGAIRAGACCIRTPCAHR